MMPWKVPPRQTSYVRINQAGQFSIGNFEEHLGISEEAKEGRATDYETPRCLRKVKDEA